VCGDAWRIQFCGGVQVHTDANVTTSTVTADCAFIDTSFGLSLAGLLLALLGSALARLCTGRARYGMLRRLLRLISACIGTATPLLVWALQPTDARTPSPPASHYLLCAGLASTSIIAALVVAVPPSASASATPTTTTTAATSAPFSTRPLLLHQRRLPSSSSPAGGGGGAKAAFSSKFA